jgi:splicing factor 3B subunit 1
VNLARVTARKM